MSDIVDRIKRSLSDPREVCGALNLLDCARPNCSDGLLIKCPSHNEHDPSCSVTVSPEGTIRVKCFACSFSGDVLTLIATVEGLDPHRDFRTVLERAARMAGISIEEGFADGPRPISPSSISERPYPPLEEVESLWNAASSVSSCQLAVEYFSDRGLKVPRMDALDLVRVIHDPLPSWAVYGSKSWIASGHRTIIPVYDYTGCMRSVRAIRIVYGAYIPKRLPPKGYRASGLVMANSPALELLSGSGQYRNVMFAEGEPDFISWASEPWREQDMPLFGIVSGSWNWEMASVIPDGTNVLIGTHNDRAGDEYANMINSTLGHRCTVRRASVKQ